MSYTDSNKEKGKSRPVPVRFSPKSDLIIRQYMEKNQVHNRNLAINMIVEDMSAYQQERERAKAEIQKLMRLWGIRLPELE